MDHAEFLQELRQAVRTQEAISGDSPRIAFTCTVTEDLIECGEIAEFLSCEYKGRGIQVDGAAFQLDDNTLDLFLTEYGGGDKVESLARADLTARFRRLESFFVKAIATDLCPMLGVGTPEADVAMRIRENAGAISRVRFFLLTDSLLSERVREISNRREAGRTWTYRVWDLERLRNLRGFGEPEEIEVDFVEMFGRPLRALPATLDNAGLKSYLTVIPGDWLAAIYERYGGRLLEQNVRTFLQARGKVNKGIRKTILTEPENFFPYNNGITTTAEEAATRVAHDLVEIHSIRKLQIVNGAQTTASLYNCLKRDKNVDLARIHVQMKLSVIDVAERFAEMVPLISQHSNSQNKISKVDFFSNHPFHVWFETVSRRVYAPPAGGLQLQTRWFYERARGQHANEMAYLTPKKREQFAAQNPRNQVISKIDLARYFNTFEQLPHEVSKGGERNFAIFASYVTEKWEANRAEFSETWFQRAVAMALVFRTLELLVSKAEWYAKGYRANLVTYGIALLVREAQEQRRALDLRHVWLRQEVTLTLQEQLLEVCRAVQDRIVPAADEYGVKNVTEWCKKTACWDDLKRTVRVRLDAPDLVSQVEVAKEIANGQKQQRFDNKAECLIEAANLGAAYWSKVLAWSPRRAGLTPNDLVCLRVAAAMPDKMPSDKQAARLMEIRHLYEANAWDV